MANVAIKSIAECTDLQKKFISALTSQEALSIPRGNSRYRWAMDQAGYAETTAIASVLAPLQPVMGEIADLILSRAAVDAAMQLADTITGDNLDAQTKDRNSAANAVLDRVVPKKETEQKSKSQPMAVIVLPAKNQSVQFVEVRESDEVPAS